MPIDNIKLSSWGVPASVAKLKAFLACQANTLMLTYFLVFECRCAGIQNGKVLPCARTTESIKLKLKSHRWQTTLHSNPDQSGNVTKDTTRAKSWGAKSWDAIWQRTAIAAAAAALFGLWVPNAAALSLGSITVQSSLGEPLRAEIDIPDINAEEAASLRATVASPDAFRAAGMDYNPAMSGLRVTVQRRPDGRAFIRLSSDKPINEPFVDMILEANWSSGRIVRDFTMLFDPPNLRAPAVAAAALPQTSSQAPSAATTPPAARNVVPSEPVQPAVAAARRSGPMPKGAPRVAPKDASAPRTSTSPPAAPRTAADGRQISAASQRTPQTMSWPVTSIRAPARSRSRGRSGHPFDRPA